MPPMQHRWTRVTIGLLVALVACSAMVVGVSARDYAADDAMPYDMSAVEQMERITTETSEQQQPQQQQEEAAASSKPEIHDAMTIEEQNFFSEKDVDAFLEARAQTHAETQATAQAQAAAKAQAQAQAAVSAKVTAESAAAMQAFDTLFSGASSRVVLTADEKADQQADLQARIRQEFQQGVRHLAQHDGSSDAAADQENQNDAEHVSELESQVDADSDADADSDSESDSDSEADADADVEDDSTLARQLQESFDLTTEEGRMAAARHHFSEVESAGERFLRQAETLARFRQKDAEEKKASHQPIQNVETKEQVSLMEAHSRASVNARTHQRAATRLGAAQPWWTSQAGVESNLQHYQSGVKNSLVTATPQQQKQQQQRGAGNAAATSYLLPVGKTASHARLNQRKQAASGVAPVRGYPLVPVQQQGASLAFNPYSGADFHPEVGIPALAPKLPEYMAESQQPFAGAGYYGSGGGQGPHPGSEAFVPLPGVEGKEFGIRAREAWEAHAAQYGSDPQAFHDASTQPNYPYFPAWSRESEIGGRPDLFPKPAFNLPTMNADAQRAARAAYEHSQRYYPQLNNAITTPPELVQAASSQQAQPVAGLRQTPRLLRQMIGYPRPTAPKAWSGARTPEAFPQPLDSNSFEELHNYPTPSSTARPILAAPYSPLAGRNIMINQGPDKGMNPLYGGYPQYIPVPVAAHQADVVATQY